MRRKLILIFLSLGILFILIGILIFPKNNSNNKFLKSSILNSISSTPQIINSSPSAIISKNLRKEFVSEVFDGDTIKTQDGEIIRYLGINSPEKTDPFFFQALEKNKALVLGKEVFLEPDITQKDRYQRSLYYVYLGSTFVNLEIVKNGLAVSQTLPPDVKYQDKILEAQRQARQNCLGLWKGLCENSKPACIKISNINFDAKGNDNTNKNGEWIEIKNTCSNNVSMNDWILKDSSASNKYTFTNFSLNSNSIVDLYSGCGQNSDNKLYWVCPEQKYAVWNNSGDHAYLYNEKGELVSDLEY
nr:thermonuclease family protein [Candidatus Levybacteria bacterium]